MCYAVAIVDEVEDDVADFIRSTQIQDYKKMKHWLTLPVIFELKSNQLHTFETLEAETVEDWLLERGSKPIDLLLQKILGPKS